MGDRAGTRRGVCLRGLQGPGGLRRSRRARSVQEMGRTGRRDDGAGDRRDPADREPRVQRRRVRAGPRSWPLTWGPEEATALAAGELGPPAELGRVLVVEEFLDGTRGEDVSGHGLKLAPG